jgi:hypothetical protein
MALQLLLSFGHVHPDEFGQAPGTAHSLVAPAAGGPADPSSPADAPDHDDCPICVVMHMVAGASPPQPPMLVVPGAFGRLPPAPLAELRLIARRFASFRTRAPPHA